MVNIAEAVQSTVPFRGLTVGIENLVRHSDTRTVDYGVALKSNHLVWQIGDDGKSTTNLTLAAASMAADGKILASRLQTVVVSVNTQDGNRLPATLTAIPMRLRLPRATKYVRVVALQNGEQGRLGSTELDNRH